MMSKPIRIAQFLLVFVAGFLASTAFFWSADTKSEARSPRPQVLEHSKNDREAGSIGRPVALENIDWRSNKKTLVLYISPHCPYCNQSAPFYRSLVEKFSGSSEVSLATLMLEPIDVAKAHLKHFDIGIDQIYQGDLDSIGIRGTPTLLLVDDHGTVLDAWIGKLSDEREAEVLRKLEG
jgi:thiol-disulfide isomerase/thioredoxin